MNMKKSVLSGLLWKFSERIAAQGVTFIVSIVLARLLAPSDYGTIALVTVFITIANVFVTNGFSNALIQKKEAKNVDFSSVFYFNIFFSVLLYVVIFLLSPLVAQFYDNDLLSPVLRVLALTVPIAAINSVQQAYVSRHMIFKKFFFSTLGGTIASAVVGISMAYGGYGVWALVAQSLCNTVVDTLVLWFTVKWRPTFEFSFSRLVTLFNYGWKLLCSGLLDTTYNELSNLIIGKLYTTSDLAYYTKGRQFPGLVVTNINTTISSVLFPAISQYQDDVIQVKRMTRRAIKTSSYVMCPLMVGLGVIAEPLVRLLLTDKWLPCVPYLQICCFIYALYPIHTANLEAMKAVGRSDLFLKLEIIKKGLGLAVLGIVMWYGVLAIALSGIATSILATFINAKPNKKLLNYGYWEQLKDLFPGLSLSVVMGAIVYGIGLISMPTIVCLLLQIVTGAIIYVGLSYWLKIESFHYLLDTCKQYVHKAK